ncbi:hypothetical protein PHET_00245 [Paragonimus heterotremus]|uniref:Cyclic nucleotide-binding domain-containing protein n=1 Tax=Paragonimus heterotremus TaxID=100268 RepID=A0A8J4SU03_9TREM|nr:hypothetical protein PHET_00245 [Paragonimus heterotremus]
MTTKVQTTKYGRECGKEISSLTLMFSTPTDRKLCQVQIILLFSSTFRRTADVRAVGYADLFVLSRKDMLDVLQDHPDAEVSWRAFQCTTVTANPFSSLCILTL